MEEHRTTASVGGERRGEEEAGLCWGLSGWREVVQRAGVSWGEGRWGFCAAAEREEGGLCGNPNWSPGGAGTVLAPGEEGKRGEALWVDLRR